MNQDTEKLIADAVAKALAGDMDAINNIEDRVLRSKAKSALVKAKREGTVIENPQTAEADQQQTETKQPAKEKTISEKVAAFVQEKFIHSLASEQIDGMISLNPESWFEIAVELKNAPDFLFDSLQCITGFDYGENQSLEVRYNLYSMTHHHQIEIRIKANRNQPRIPSVEQVWRIGDWFERETYDMYGIEFSGHRYLKRLLCPEDWEGWPLRKDYITQETYHGIVVPKVKVGWE